MRRAALLVTLALLGACAIQPDARPRDIPVDDRLLVEPPSPEAGATAGSTGRRIYLVADDDDDRERTLEPVLRNIDPLTPKAVLDELFRGPNPDEFEAGFRTALPDTLTLDSAIPAGTTLIVDVSPEILELSGQTLELAVAQIVFTASELDRIRDVRLRVDGEQRAWPDGRGELQTDPLTVYDFPDFVESTQPPFPAIPSEVPA